MIFLVVLTNEQIICIIKEVKEKFILKELHFILREGIKRSITVSSLSSSSPTEQL